jgi:hypothetical protein
MMAPAGAEPEAFQPPAPVPVANGADPTQADIDALFAA